MHDLSEVIHSHRFQNTNTNTSDSVIKNTNTKTLMQVTQIANTLSDRLNNPSRLEYYCKVAWQLPEHIIWNNLEAAMKGRDPQRLFSYLCSQTMKKAPEN